MYSASTHSSSRASAETARGEERELLTHWSSRRRYAASAAVFKIRGQSANRGWERVTDGGTEEREEPDWSHGDPVVFY